MKVRELIEVINHPHLLDLPIKIDVCYHYSDDIDSCITYYNDYIGLVPSRELVFGY